jgi:E3 ubiquitin-protein ligase DOA10
VRIAFPYFGFGIMTNLFLFGPINWSSGLAWAVLLLWPAFWLVIAFTFGLVIYLIAIFLCLIGDTLDQIGFVRAWNKRRTDKRIRKFLRRARA